MVLFIGGVLSLLDMSGVYWSSSESNWNSACRKLSSKAGNFSLGESNDGDIMSVLILKTCKTMVGVEAPGLWECR